MRVNNKEKIQSDSTKKTSKKSKSLFTSATSSTKMGEQRRTSNVELTKPDMLSTPYGQSGDQQPCHKTTRSVSSIPTSYFTAQKPGE
jgi:hypothetical protein